MQYRLVATDMDGTMLNAESEITPHTKETIHKAIEKGVVFTLCTGRALRGVKKYIDRLNLDEYVITNNGAVIVHSRTGEIMYNRIMDREEARRVYDIAVEKGAMFILWSQNRLYASEIGEKSRFYENITSAKAAPIEDFEQLLADGITKMLWYEDLEWLDKRIEELKEENFQATTFVKSRPFFMEFFSNKASKAIAMEKLGEKYGITRDAMIAIGDQTNDLPMIEYAGLGVAMGNAVDAVKEKADYITDTNTEEGMAKVLEKFIL